MNYVQSPLTSAAATTTITTTTTTTTTTTPTTTVAVIRFLWKKILNVFSIFCTQGFT